MPAPGSALPLQDGEARIAKSAHFSRPEELLGGQRGVFQQKPRVGEGRMEERLKNTVTGRAGRGPGLPPGVPVLHGGQCGQTTKGVFSWASVGTQPRTQGLRCHPSSWPCHPHLAGPLTSARHRTPQSSVSFTLYLRAGGEPRLPSSLPIRLTEPSGSSQAHPFPRSCPGTPASG